MYRFWNPNPNLFQSRIQCDFQITIQYLIFSIQIWDQNHWFVTTFLVNLWQFWNSSSGSITSFILKTTRFIWNIQWLFNSVIIILKKIDFNFFFSEYIHPISKIWVSTGIFPYLTVASNKDMDFWQWTCVNKTWWKEAENLIW